MSFNAATHGSRLNAETENGWTTNWLAHLQYSGSLHKTTETRFDKKMAIVAKKLKNQKSTDHLVNNIAQCKNSELDIDSMNLRVYTHALLAPNANKF